MLVWSLLDGKQIVLSVQSRADLDQIGLVFAIDVAVADQEGQIGHLTRQLELSGPHRLLDIVEGLQVQLSDFAIANFRNNVLAKLHLVKVLYLAEVAVSITLP